MRIRELTESQHNFTTAYHITTVENADNITYGGLDPYDGNAYLIVDTGNKEKLSNDFRTVAGWMLAKTERTQEPLTLLKVDITGIPLEKDSGWYVAKMPIPAERITNMGEAAFARVA